VTSRDSYDWHWDQRFEWTFVCLFVCLFNSYIVSLFRESMREIIYSDFSHHLYTIKARKWWSFEFSKWWSFKISNRLTFVLRLVSWCWCFVAFDLSNAMSLLSNALKTIKSFYRMISKRSNSLKSNFLKFFLWLRFLFRAHLVHAKMTLSDDREYYRECDDDRWE
jgi:hypothetical protein